MKKQKLTHPWIPSLKFNGRRLQQKQSAFTLVELIVVITILAILWTIAFISLQWYSAQSRDAVRISDIWNLARVLELSRIKWETVPKPENSIQLTASGTLIGYQWEAWKDTLSILWMFNGWKDPLEETFYTYSTNDKLTKYQVLWFLETGEQISMNSPHPNPLPTGEGIEQANAKDLSKRTVYTKWDELWILLNSVTKEPSQKDWLNIDLVTTTNEYNLVFNEANDVILTWWILFSTMYNSRKDLLVKKEYASLDPNLVWYWDMETTTLSGSAVVLKDLSESGNNWKCYSGATVVDCWSSTWPQFTESGLKTWKYMNFNWTCYILSDDSSSLSITGDITFLALSKADVWYNASFYRILSKQYHTSWSNNWGYSLYVNNSSKFESTIRYDNSPYVFSTTSSSTNEVTHTAVVYSKKDLKYSIYVNWKKEYTRTSYNWAIKDTTDPFMIWTWYDWNQWIPTNTYPWHWIIDEVRVYNRALSDNEIETLYESTK